MHKQGLFFFAMVFVPGILISALIDPGALVVEDGFDGDAEPGAGLGSPPGVSAVWRGRFPGSDATPPANTVRRQKDGLIVGYRSGVDPHDTGVWLDGVQVQNAVVSVTIGPSLMPDRAAQGGISYRAATGSAAAGLLEEGAYHAQINGDWSGTRDVTLRYGRDLLAVADVADDRQADSVHRLEVRFAGACHQVWLDGERILEFWDHVEEREREGYVGFGGFYAIARFDDFRLTAATLRPTAQAGSGDGRLQPIMFQGRPMFLNGTFDRPRPDDEDEWLAAGGNAYVAHMPGPEASVAELETAWSRHVAWAEPRNVALLVYPKQNSLWVKDEDGPGFRVPTEEEIPPRRAYLERLLEVVADHPNTLGYWLFDEPENALYRAYKQWDTGRDAGLAEWILEGMKWSADTIRERDRDGLIMPTIAWYTTYEALADLYDVNVPNDYPPKVQHPVMEAPLYNVVYDAMRAADAARAAGKPCFVYMPGTYDVIGGDLRASSEAELRYQVFAPITQGAMGILSWRLGRCTLPYRRAAVYPVMREINQLTPWLLGEDRSEQVSSDRDQAGVEYLKAFPERIRTVANEEGARMQVVEGVPDCSYCLKRRPNNSFLLLAVNNRKDPMDVTFSFSGFKDLPEKGLEVLQYREVSLADGTLHDRFGPFAVHAYRIDMK